MSVIVVIPVKAPPGRKSRLAAVLDPAARDTLVVRMASHVATTAQQATRVDHVAFLTSGSDGLSDAVDRIGDNGGGLNAALSTMLAKRAGRRVVILPGDLPLLTVRDVELLVALPDRSIGISPDRHETGTNALSLPLPDAAGFRFAFGQDSLALHRAEAQRLGLAIVEVRSHGLARDIDLPDDLSDAGQFLEGNARP